MYPFNHHSEFPQQQSNFLPNLHNSSSPCNLSYERMNPFHQYQNYHLPNQIGNFLPQTLDQDSNPIFAPANNGHHQNTYSNFPYHPNAPYERFTYNQASLGQSSSPKKDRHKKISTARGVRDRRVRLSMEIAREFFHLQDMLGFDKASNTIEWLISKSKGAIHELILKNHSSGLTRSNSSSSSSYEEEIVRRRKGKVLARRGSTSCKSLASDNYSQEENEKIIVENQVNCSVARENRAKARARARERTKEKLSTMAKLIQFDELGLQTSGKAGCSLQFLMDNEGCNATLQNLNGLNVIRSQDSSPSLGCTDYLQNLLSSSSKGDQDGSVRVTHPPNSHLWSNYNPDASATMCSSSFELGHLQFSKWNAHDW